MENLLKNFVTLEMFRFERPRLSTMTDDQIQEALNIASGLLDSVCNGLISLVVQYSLSREVKDENHELFRTDFELQQIKNAIVFQAQYVLNLGNDFTIGSSSASTGGINYSFQRPESRQELAPGVKEFLSRARVFELTNIGASSKKQDCGVLKTLLDIEDGDRRYLQKYQPNAEVGSIATIGEGHTISFVNPNNTQWSVKQANMIVDKGGDYHYLWEYPELAFFGDNVNNAISKKEAYQAIWNAMWWNKMTTYPNEAIVRYYDYDNNIVYTYKSNQDGNIGHNPLKDNQDEHWWKLVLTNDNIDVQALANTVLDSKEFNNFLSKLKQEIDNNNEALWEQIKDNPHLLKKFEELYDQTQVENEQLEQKLDTKIEANKTSIDTINQSLSNVAYINRENNFIAPQNIKNSRNVNIIRFTQSTSDNAGGIHNPNGRLIIGGKNGISLSSTITYDGNTAITQPKQLTTKAYVDAAVEQAKNEGVDLSNVVKTNESANLEGPVYFFGNDQGTVGFAGKAQYSNASYEPTDDNELAPKSYVDKLSSSSYVYVSGLHTFSLTKFDVTKGIYCYYFGDNSIPLSNIPQNLRNKKVLCIIDILAIETPNDGIVDNLIYLGALETVVADEDHFNLNTQATTIILPFDLKPGASGNIQSNMRYRISVISVN